MKLLEVQKMEFDLWERSEEKSIFFSSLFPK